MMERGSQLHQAAARAAAHRTRPRPPGTIALERLLESRRLIVCVGSGGVGKTTTTALLGVVAARRGRQAAVLTIDPARRLRDALGIQTLDDQPHRVPLERVDAAATGSLDAMLLDAKRTFDGLIRDYAPTPEAAERVLANRIYQSVSTALAGSQEYMAMERLHAIAASRRYDLLIVDTPPTQHALDFLDAPARLVALLTSRAAAILQNPALILARGGSRIAQAALGAVLRGLERFTGFDLLRDISEFVAGIEHYGEGFQQRAEAVSRFLHDRETAFLLVTTPEAARVGETLAFHAELERAGLPFGGFIVNRVLPPELLATVPVDTIEAGPDAALARKLVAVQRRYATMVAAERAELERLRRAAPNAPIVELALRTDEPTSLERLVALADGE